MCNWVNFHKVGTPMYSKPRSRNRIFWSVTLGPSHHDPAFGTKGGYYPNVTPGICSAFLNFRKEELSGIITWVRLWFPVGSNCWWVLVPPEASSCLNERFIHPNTELSPVLWYFDEGSYPQTYNT